MEDFSFFDYRIAKNIGVKYGVITTVMMILYFLTMMAMGLAEKTELRAFNFILQMIGIHLAFREYKHSHNGKIKYLKGFGVGGVTALVNTLSFALFMFIFLGSVDPELMQYIKENEPMGDYLTPFLCAVAITMEGLFTGLLNTFILMQYEKTGHLARRKPPTKSHDIKLSH
ncbi:DUF4199 domain-containing protein [Xanthovirga aplysinae]|uniref:DUF4199 domain-containing protein n=1 Tax=Xanthovirga aplysinae TaxID=2529853 RepID=UPI0012BBF7F6|nr:DUF4199 domain-containing protein [Xanthovirga aplysinae]MTI29438.1 DUF4199 domain-containing protein [Xanthovirga aplysinae]